MRFALVEGCGHPVAIHLGAPLALRLAAAHCEAVTTTGSGSKTFLADLIRKNMPTREALEGNRWTRKLALRHELWRFTRRSVPRGVAVGLLVGIFALIPGVQIIGAALLCVPGRGNIPVAAAMTFLSNPATTPLILILSAMIGNFMGFHADIATVQAMVARGAPIEDWTGWFLSDAAPAVLVGLAIFAVVAAAIGYLVSSVVWRVIVARKRTARLRKLERRLEDRQDGFNA